MSDYRDPRDPREPIHRDPAYETFNDPVARNDMRDGAYSPGTTIAWFVGIALFIGVMIFAFSGGDNERVAGTDTTPKATQSSPPASSPATPPAATPPAKSPSAPQQ
jgi:hypothetical protein